MDNPTIPLRPLATIPPNVQLVREALLDTGHATAVDLAARLRSQGIIFTPDRLRSLASSFPALFEVLEDGALSARLAVDEGAALDPLSAGPWWEAWDAGPRLDPGDVVVFDIETTGLDPNRDAVWELGAVNLGTGEQWQVRVELPPGCTESIPALAHGEVEHPLGVALALLDEFVGGRAVAGHNVAGFDLPFLVSVAEQLGLAWSMPPRVLDLLPLSVLARPDLPARTLASLCREFEVPLEGSHRALLDARATAEVIRRILAEINPDDAPWALAAACLTRGGNLWPSLMPEFATWTSLQAALCPADDPLATVGAGAAHIKDLGAAFDALRVADPGFETRTGQQEMARAVAETLGGGGRSTQLARRVGSLKKVLENDPPVAYGGGGSEESRQASSCIAIAETLMRAGIGKEPDVRPGSVVAWAGVRVFAETSRIEEVALRLGMRSLDRAARFIGWDWAGGQELGA